jgi:putative ATP-dependent endonuclease of OLD family
MRELCSVKVAVERAQARAEAKAVADPEDFIRDIEYVGKGRFAQRLAAHIATSPVKTCPAYILSAVKYLIV